MVGYDLVWFMTQYNLYKMGVAEVYDGGGGGV